MDGAEAQHRFALALNLVRPDVKFSEQENRELAQKPKFSVESLFSGDFMTKYESYVTDQFTLRDQWISLKAGCEIGLGKKDNKGVYLCKDGSLIEKYKKPDQKLLDDNMSAVRGFAEKASVPVHFALIPGSAEIRKDMLPSHAPNYSQADVINYCYERSGADNIDIMSAMEPHKDEYIYYNTDHHWTSLGASYAAERILEGLGRPVPDFSKLSPDTVTDDFHGTVYSKSGFTWVEPDTIEIFKKQLNDTQVFNYFTGEAKETSMYDRAYLDKKDKYSMFMGGITPQAVIKTGVEDAPSILIIRDSYTDSLVPFLQESFSEIHLLDLRYYKALLTDYSIHDYIKDNNIDEAFVCYSVSNFGNDTNIYLLDK